MSIRTMYIFTILTVMLLIGPANTGLTQEGKPTAGQPLSFGPGQTLIDLSQVHFEPLKSEGVPPGPEIAVLRGNMSTGPVEVLLRLPANYTFPNHSHSSDETYVWLKGPFTYINGDGR